MASPPHIGPDAAALTVILIAAFSLAGIAQVMWLRTKSSRGFARPIDAGRRFRGRPLLGANKTWRGFMVMVPASACAFVLISALRPALPDWLAQGLWSMDHIDYLLVGAWAGFGFMVGELPNSFVKRQFDIASGEAPRHWASRMLFAIVDRVDSILGMLIALALVVPVPAATWLYVLIFGPGIHLAFSAMLYAANVKPRLA